SNPGLLSRTQSCCCFETRKTAISTQWRRARAKRRRLQKIVDVQYFCDSGKISSTAINQKQQPATKPRKIDGSDQLRGALTVLREAIVPFARRNRVHLDVRF